MGVEGALFAVVGRIYCYGSDDGRRRSRGQWWCVHPSSRLFGDGWRGGRVVDELGGLVSSGQSNFGANKAPFNPKCLRGSLVTLF